MGLNFGPIKLRLGLGSELGLWYWFKFEGKIDLLSVAIQPSHLSAVGKLRCRAKDFRVRDSVPEAFSPTINDHENEA